MKKSLSVRATLSVTAIALTVAANLALVPTTALMSANAVLGQMAHSDASYVSAMTEVNAVSLLARLPGWMLLLALVVIWGFLLFTNRKNSQ